MPYGTKKRSQEYLRAPAGFVRLPRMLGEYRVFYVRDSVQPIAVLVGKMSSYVKTADPDSDFKYFPDEEAATQWYKGLLQSESIKAFQIYAYSLGDNHRTLEITVQFDHAQGKWVKIIGAEKSGGFSGDHLYPSNEYMANAIAEFKKRHDELQQQESRLKREWEDFLNDTEKLAIPQGEQKSE